MNKKDNAQLDDQVDEQEPGTAGDKLQNADPEPAVQYLIDTGTPGDVKTLMTIGSGSSQPMVMHTVSVEPPAPDRDDSNIIKVRIKYPSKYSKPKFFKDGDVKEVSKETADIFIRQGFAKLLIEEKQAE